MVEKEGEGLLVVNVVVIVEGVDGCGGDLEGGVDDGEVVVVLGNWCWW